MKVTREKTENSQALLTIEVEPAEVEKSLEASYRRLVKKTNIPGFRKGKAPRTVLEHYIGKEGLLEDALNNLLPKLYEQAVKEQEVEAVAQPHIEVVQTDPVVFKAVVPLPPTITLGDYHQIQVAPPTVEVTEDDISSALEHLRHQHATWEPVGHAVDMGDLVVLDIESSIEGEPFISRKGVQYQILQNLPFPAPGFAEQLLGMKGGEDKEFSLKFPEDYPQAELVGKEAWFKIRVTEIKEEKLPELSDDFAKGISPDFKGLDSLREQVANSLRLRAEEKANIDFEEQVVQALVALAQLEFPPILVEMEIGRLLDQQSRRLQMRDTGLEEYLKSINKTEAELREELRPLATERVTRSLVLGKFAEEEKIEVSDSEISAEAETMVNSAAENKDELQKFLDTEHARDSIRQLLITRKTIQRLMEIAKGSGKDNVE